MTIPSTSAQDFLKTVNDPNFLNCIAILVGLDVVSDGIRYYVEQKMKQLHSNLLGTLGRVTCMCGVGAKRHVKKCQWATELRNLHRNPHRILWSQSDNSKWHDPVHGYWEIAKIFMSNLGSDWKSVKDPSTTDFAGLINLMIFCKHFNVKDTLLKNVREWRNKLAHSKKLIFSDDEKRDAFNGITSLLDDAELMSCQKVQDCREVIKTASVTKDISILQERNLEFINELKNLRKEQGRQTLEELRKYVEERISLENERRNKENEMKLNGTYIIIVNEIFFFLIPLLSYFYGLLQTLVYYIYVTTQNGLLHFFFLLHRFQLVFLISILVSQIGDKTAMFVDQECSNSIRKSPISHFHFQEFNFSSYLIYKGEQFFGRKWLFNELEEIFVTGRGRPEAGVLIIGEPGSGKTALMSRLICSPFSSWFINKNIIGYHMCVYAERGKRNGGRFVRNLVDQIAGTIPEYSNRLESDEHIRRTLDIHCENDPIGCFSSAIIDPLRDISEPNNIRYILIDALDECLENDGKTSPILDMLTSKISYFPKWLKIILTSRNWTVVTNRIPQTVKQISLKPTDERNIEDIRSYITHTLSLNSRFTTRLSEAISFKSSTDAINLLIDELLKNDEGNFLVVKTTLQHMSELDGPLNIYSFPKSLSAAYNIFFIRHFAKKKFSEFRTFIEVLLAAESPFQISEISSILKFQNETQEISTLVDHMSSFLRFGEDGYVWIYHKSLAEWLVEQATRPGGFSLSKSNGHQYIVDFIFERISKENTSLSFQKLSELSLHVVLGGCKEKHIQTLERLSNIEIIEPNTGRTILHNLAIKDNALPVLEIFLRKFKSADILDGEGKSPAYYAASEGKFRNLEFFISKGANVNFVSKNIPTDPIEIVFLNKGMEDFSMMHMAAIRGHSKIVEVLLNNNFTYPKSDKPTPLLLAAKNGHLDVVKLLYKYETDEIDRLILLHHAAAKNNLAIVGFFLKTVGIRDQCLICKSDNRKQKLTVRKVHLTFCETALHAAVSRRHYDIAQLLLNYGSDSLQCKHSSGKTVLMDAVERNDIKMVTLLLDKGANVKDVCDKAFISGPLNEELCANFKLYENSSLYTLYCKNDECGCGIKASHLAAQLGLWEIAMILLPKENSNLRTKNCNGDDILDVAIKFDQAHFIYNIIRARFPVNEVWVIAKAARCASIKILALFKFNLDTVDLKKKDLTLLGIAALWSPYPKSPLFHSCSQVVKGDYIFVKNKVEEESRKRVTAIKLILKSQKHSTLNKKSKMLHGGTILHRVASSGFTDAVKCLVGLGADYNITNDDGKTPLELALDASPMFPDGYTGCYTTNDGIFTSCKTTSYDATVAYLISLQASNINICNTKSANLLFRVTMKQMALSLYTLLKIGVDMNCDIEQPIYPFLQHLNVGGEEISEVFKIFGVDVTVKCGVPFRYSEIHLMSYSSVSDEVGNFFKPAVNKKKFPLQRFIEKHPKHSDIFEECRDAEGYLALHRAVQGGNFDAINWFINIGVDMSLKTSSGLTALDLSIIYLADHRETKTLYSRVEKSHPLSSPKYLQTFEKLLQEYFTTFRCDSKFNRLSPLHIAATKGVDMVKYVYNKAREFVPGLRLDCSNQHWIVPQYVAYFHKSLKSTSTSALTSTKQLKSAHCNNVDVKFLQYPDREAEYHIIYNYFYESPSDERNTMFYKLLLKEFEYYDVADCPGFNDFLPFQKAKKEPEEDIIMEQDEHIEIEVVDFLDVLKILNTQSCVTKQPNKMLNLYRQQICTMQERLKLEQFAKENYCPLIKRHLLEWFTRIPRRNTKISKFIAERMGWTDVSEDGDIQPRWPFYFLYKKLRNEYKDYKYLEALKEALEIQDGDYRREND